MQSELNLPQVPFQSDMAADIAINVDDSNPTLKRSHRMKCFAKIRSFAGKVNKGKVPFHSDLDSEIGTTVADPNHTGQSPLRKKSFSKIRSCAGKVTNGKVETFKQHIKRIFTFKRPSKLHAPDTAIAPDIPLPEQPAVAATPPPADVINAKENVQELAKAITVIISPITIEMRAQDLSKSALSIALPITIAILFMDSHKIEAGTITNCVKVGVGGQLLGCALIWNGLFLRTFCSEVADISENLGVLLVFFSINVLAMSAVPKYLSWLPLLCSGGYFVPYVVAMLRKPIILLETTENDTLVAQVHSSKDELVDTLVDQVQSSKDELVERITETKLMELGKTKKVEMKQVATGKEEIIERSELIAKIGVGTAMKNVNKKRKKNVKKCVYSLPEYWTS